MKKKVFYFIIGIVVFLILSKSLEYIGKNQMANIENKPKKYAYQWRLGYLVPALLADNIECVPQLIKYHTDTIPPKSSFKVPGCADRPVSYEVPIYVLEDIDSVTVKIGWYIMKESGIEKYYSGYIFKGLLHDFPPELP